MALDGITLGLVKDELKTYILGSKIEKIYIPKNVTEIQDFAFNHYESYGKIIIGGENGSEAEGKEDTELRCRTEYHKLRI